MIIVWFGCTVIETEKTVLVLAGQHTVTSQAADMLDEPVVLYKTDHFIRGSILIFYYYLFFIFLLLICSY
jgi:hypothetical protein